VPGPVTDLVRLTRGADGAVRVGGPSAGRGAWVGAGPECLAAAEKRVARALRAREPLAFAALTAEWDGTIRALGRQTVAPDWCPRAGRAVGDPG
jgi:predicted RNA-binding protein YlxR (DUF448 family)